MTQTRFMTADDAVALIKDGDTVAISGNGNGMAAAESVLAALEKRFLDTGHPRDLTLIHSLGGSSAVSQGRSKSGACDGGDG